MLINQFVFKYDRVYGRYHPGRRMTLSNWGFLVLRQIFFLSPFIVEIAQNFLYNLINTPGNSHNFCPWRSLVELGENGLWTWLPNIFLKFGVSLVVILTHLEICTGSLDNRFKKPLALSFQNTPWKTDLKMNFLRNFHFKINFFCILGSVLTLSLSNWIFFVSWQIFFLGHLIVEIA